MPGSTTTPRRLVIVESPAKAKTIAGYLGPGYVVESSIGHIRDLPRNAADVPASAKDKPWSRLGVDTDNGFAPLYIVTPDKRAQVAKLKGLLKDVDELYLATDEDREGEAIAWHLAEVLKPKVPVKRMVFHEITPAAIEAAVSQPRTINKSLVDAQETRRILDRLYGYEVSPVLWKKVMPRLSAGRVQSVATRIIVERERERIAFTSAEYWDVTAILASSGHADPVEATLQSVDGVRLATGKDFGSDGQLAGRQVLHLNQERAEQLATGLAGATFTVSEIDEKPYTRRPYAPFITSTLQQEAGRKLRMSSSQTMRVAQRLYENGYITYMRTDSTTLSETAVRAARRQARELYGAEYVPDAPRVYSRKVKNAQEAHEAIRPAGDDFRTPAQVRSDLARDEFRLYELIWQRTIASQMMDAKGKSVSVKFTAEASDHTQTVFSASGKTITFPGFLRAYVEGADDPDAELDNREKRLPPLERSQRLAADSVTADGHSTNPPARYTEASLVKRLEELGVGRPSTYASIISTIQDRGYVFTRGQALIPSFTAFAVVGLLEKNFSQLVDYAFTASMEDDLDAIAGGAADSREWLTRFYFGDAGEDNPGLKALVDSRLGDIDAREINSIPIGKDDSGRMLVARVGRFGPYVQRENGEDSERASIPETMAPDELTVAVAEELLSKPSGDRTLGLDPQTGRTVVAKDGRYGPYVMLEAGESKDETKSASLLKSMSLDTISLDDALRLLTLPRVLGVDADGNEITAQNGRYGPYVKRGTDSRSLDNEERLFTVTLDEALALLAAPKVRRGAASAAPLRELGEDPATGRPVVVKEGRFGPYVTDGESNASLRKGDAVETITIERASELLEMRRAKGDTPRKRTTKKTAAKKTTAKKTAAKKTAAKKTTTRKRTTG